MNSTNDLNAAQRKQDHIELAFKSQMNEIAQDKRFYYEPLLAAHPEQINLGKSFLGKPIQLPIWISSMTGGTAMAGTINRNLAQACADFGIGMGLGSCRKLLLDNQFFNDFNLRPIIGKALPFYANLGIAQLEQLDKTHELQRVVDLIGKLQADGLIIHVNPLQEWLQPEGDRFTKPPIDTIESILTQISTSIIVKEVGQGIGPKSMSRLLQLPLAAIEFGAFGGTNFAKLELLRNTAYQNELFESVSNIGHTANEMVNFVNTLVIDLGTKLQCKEIIVSGGIKHFLDGYYSIECIHLNSVYAQGAAFLKHAQHSYSDLRNYVEAQANGLALAYAYLNLK